MSSAKPSRWQARATLVVVLISGALFPLGFAPLAWRPLAFVALAGLVWSARQSGAAAGFLRGWLWGLGAFGVGVSWVYNSMHDFGGAMPLAAASFTTLFVVYLALFPGLVVALWRGCFAASACVYQQAVFLGAAWAALEWLRGWLMTGFPWLPTGSVLLDTPFEGLLPMLGGLGAGAVAVAVLVLVVLGTGRQRLLGLALALIVWPLQWVEWGEPAGDPVEVALIQGNIPQELKMQRRHLNVSLQAYRKLSQPYWRSADIVVWPETAVPTYDNQVGGFWRYIERDMAHGQAALLTGVFQRAENGRDYYNAMLEVGGQGQVYRKHQLVPFGEYMPLRWAMEVFSAFVDIPMSDMASGPLQRAPMVLSGVPVGVSICYEMVYPDVMRAVLPNAQLLVNASNDAWFGDSFAPHQHLEMARLRAREFARPIARATNTGITAAIDAKGRVNAVLPSFKADSQLVDIQPWRGSTPFTFIGQWWLGVALTLGLIIGMVWRKRHVE